jgi:hypothetical protein
MPQGGVAFYNCGEHSGRSQPHKHLQVRTCICGKAMAWRNVSELWRQVERAASRHRQNISHPLSHHIFAVFKEHQAHVQMTSRTLLSTTPQVVPLPFDDAQPPRPPLQVAVDAACGGAAPLEATELRCLPFRAHAARLPEE